MNIKKLIKENKLVVLILLFAMLVQLSLEVDAIASRVEEKEDDAVEFTAYLNGYEDGTVRPNTNISREEVATIFNRVFDLKETGQMKEFKDLNKNRWSYENLSTNVKANILIGYKDGSIRPEASITRAEAATMLVRYKGGIDNSKVSSNEYKNHWGAKEIQTAINKGYIKGYEDGSIRPDDKITRAEFATIINRVTGRNYDIKNLKNIKEFKDLRDNSWYFEDMVRATNNYNSLKDKETDKEIDKEVELPIIIGGGESGGTGSNNDENNNDVGKKLANLDKAQEQIDRFYGLTKGKYEEEDYNTVEELVKELEDLIKDGPTIEKQKEIDELTDEVKEAINNLITKELKEILDLLEEIKIDKLKVDEKELIEKFEETNKPKKVLEDFLSKDDLGEEDPKTLIDEIDELIGSLQADFEFVRTSGENVYFVKRYNEKGYYRYIGKDPIVEIPKYIKGHKIDNYYNMFNSTSIEKVSSGNEVTNMSNMFESIKSTSLDLSDFDTSNVTNMSGMFNRAHGLEELDVSNFDTSNVINMSDMFKSCSGLEKLDVSSLDTSKVTNMSGMFRWVNGLERLDVSGFNTSKVTDMSGMFEGCLGLSELDLSNLDTSNVKDMSKMFSSCGSLRNLDLSNLDTSSVANMSGMFYYCNKLESLDLSNLDTSSVTNMSEMFSSCFSLTSLNLRSLDTSNVMDMSSMFSSCKELKSIDLSSFDTSNVTNMSGIFTDCSKLTNVYVRTQEYADRFKNDGGLADSVEIIVKDEDTNSLLFDINLELDQFNQEVESFESLVVEDYNDEDYNTIDNKIKELNNKLEESLIESQEETEGNNMVEEE